VETNRLDPYLYAPNRSTDTEMAAIASLCSDGTIAGITLVENLLCYMSMKTLESTIMAIPVSVSTPVAISRSNQGRMIHPYDPPRACQQLPSQPQAYPKVVECRHT
jgi:hypothetical protein